MKLITCSLIFILLIQGCVVYQGKPTDLEDAYGKGMVKVIAVDGSKLKYDNLIQKNGVLYGAKGYVSDPTNFWREYARDEEGKKVLNYSKTSSEIKSIHLKNKPLTTTLHVIPPLAVGVGILMLVAIGTGMAGFSY